MDHPMGRTSGFPPIRFQTVMSGRQRRQVAPPQPNAHGRTSHIPRNRAEDRLTDVWMPRNWKWFERRREVRCRAALRDAPPLGRLRCCRPGINYVRRVPADSAQRLIRSFKLPLRLSFGPGDGRFQPFDTTSHLIPDGLMASGNHDRTDAYPRGTR